MTPLPKIAATLIVVAALMNLALADNDERSQHRERGSAKSDVAAVSNDLYVKECGGCHFAYQPGLLPARSWNKIMDSLNNHFGENADPAEAATEAIDGTPPPTVNMDANHKTDTQILRDYLLVNAADHSSSRRSQKIMESLGDHATPLRITEVGYIQRKHHEVPAAAFKQKDGIKSLSNCKACHTRAETGSYSEHEIKIPGLGNWD